MARRSWKAKTDITPELVHDREKRKWQIALRRYVIDGFPCLAYAPYFGLDSKTLRGWFECQFEDGMNWKNFANNWQFDQIIPLLYFDLSNESELRICWNFTNLKVEPVKYNTNRGHRIDMLAAKSYFKMIFDKNGYLPCQKLLEKIARLESAELLNSDKQINFFDKYSQHLQLIQGYSQFEFELLNKGKSIEEVNREAEQFKKLIRT